MGVSPRQRYLYSQISQITNLPQGSWQSVQYTTRSILRPSIQIWKNSNQKNPLKGENGRKLRKSKTGGKRCCVYGINQHSKIAVWTPRKTKITDCKHTVHKEDGSKKTWLTWHHHGNLERLTRASITDVTVRLRPEPSQTEPDHHSLWAGGGGHWNWIARPLTPESYL